MDQFGEVDQAHADLERLKEKHLNQYGQILLVKKVKKKGKWIYSTKAKFKFWIIKSENENKDKALISFVEKLKNKWPATKTKPERTIINQRTRQKNYSPR